MKSKFDIYNINLTQKLQYLYVKNIINTSIQEYTGQNRSKILDFTTIYPTEPKSELLGR